MNRCCSLQDLECISQLLLHIKSQRLLKNGRKSVSKSFVSSLTDQLDPKVNED